MKQWIRDNYGWHVKKREWITLGLIVFGVVVFLTVAVTNWDSDAYMQQVTNLQQP